MITIIVINTCVCARPRVSASARSAALANCEARCFGGGEGTVDRDAVASNRSTGTRLSNFNKRISSKSSN